MTLEPLFFIVMFHFGHRKHAFFREPMTARLPELSSGTRQLGPLVEGGRVHAIIGPMLRAFPPLTFGSKARFCRS